MRNTGLGLAMLALAGCSVLRPAARQQQPAGVDNARVQLADSSGRRIGEASLQQTPNGVIMTLDLSGAPPGSHGLHFHAVGECQPPFTSAGPHFNPTGRAHGLRNPNGPHAGDMPNVYVPESGALRADLLVTGVSLQPGPNSLLDADGSALVLHAFADDYVTDPSGGSGARIACGVVRR
jgi:Cu-Zn family superoxide dismutase